MTALNKTSSARLVLPTCLCGNTDLHLKFSYDKPAPGDKAFQAMNEPFLREIYECRHCGHHMAINNFELGDLYGGLYVETTYGDNLERTFEKIIGLPPEQSDNAGRVDNLLAFVDRHFGKDRKLSVMDVGSGLCVFLYQIKKFRPDWVLTAVDPDPVQSAHARKVVGVEAIQSDFMKLEGQDKRFDIITFNKVLEHVPDPVAMLAKAGTYLKEGGIIYLELPDATQAAREGAHRQEFFTEHVCAFSMASIVILAERAGFTPVLVERLHEPSKKYTLRAFLTGRS